MKYSSFDTVDDLTKHIEQFIDTWDEHFAHPFDWRYKGEELHGKAVRRFIRHIITKSPEMGLSFLVSQFKLMRNLMKDYFGKVEVKDWQSLIGAIEENKDYLHSIITESEQPRLKKQAVKVYEELLGAWKSTLLAESCVRS